MRRVCGITFLLVALAGLVALGLPSHSAPQLTATVACAVDGNTIEVLIENAPVGSPVVSGQSVTVRYIGVNTPEAVDPNKPVEVFGKEASDFNRSLVEGGTVYLELDVEPWDRDSRLLAYVYLDAEGYAMVNAILVAMGFAYASSYPPNIRYESVFRDLERTARELGLGLWYLGVTQTVPETELNTEAPCNCSCPDLNCSRFSTQAAAQRCYDYCKLHGYRVLFRLDGDKDGRACESLP